jgi:hypothetical protein
VAARRQLQRINGDLKATEVNAEKSRRSTNVARWMAPSSPFAPRNFVQPMRRLPSGTSFQMTRSAPKGSELTDEGVSKIIVDLSSSV